MKKAAVKFFPIVLRDSLKHGQPPAWKSEEAVQAYLGERPLGARLVKWMSAYPHGPGNTKWSTQTSNEERLAAKDLRYRTRTPLYLQSLRMQLTKGEPL